MSADSHPTDPQAPAAEVPAATVAACVSSATSGGATADSGAAGTRVSRYLIEDEIAHGGMGVVYRARDLDLGRTLALKVLSQGRCGKAEAERRFREEAQITGQLQHPCIPPVHEIGTLPDGRPFFAMKLIKGRTLDELLAERKPAQSDLPHLLGIFEQVCQAVAYAHSRRIIHRDLKPANIMVGAFGEVQVMDWGLSKLLGQPAAPLPDDEPMSTIATTRMDVLDSYSRDGDIIGTPGYMSPEQARGDIDQVDERSDVFGLGAMLCKIVTGEPPFAGGSKGERQARSARGDMVDTFARLESSGVDGELIELARTCLAPERARRPQDAGEVARAVAAYRESVQERLRRSELGRAQAEIRAQEERKRRRLVVGLAAVLFLLVLGAATVAWLWQQQRARAQARRLETDQETLAVLQRGRELLSEGLAEQDLVKLADAKARADRAVAIARTGSASTSVRDEADDFQSEAEQQLEQARADSDERLRHAERNRLLLLSLLDISAPREAGSYVGSEAGPATAVPQPSVDEQYASAFRRWGIDLDHADDAAVLARLESEPGPVIREIVAALDSWMLDRRRQGKADEEWQRLVRLAERLDHSDRGHELRSFLGSDLPPRPESVVELFATSPPWAGIWELTRGRQWRRFVELRRNIDPATEPVLTLVLLTEISVSLGDVAWAEQMLRQATSARGDEVVLLHSLGKLLQQQGRLNDAVEYYRAARARDPHLGVALAKALQAVGRSAESEIVLHDLVRQEPDNPDMHYYLAWSLLAQRKFSAAEAAYREVIRLMPNRPEAHLMLGGVLGDQGKTGDAEDELLQAMRLRPMYVEASNNLGVLHILQNKPEQAEAEFRTAIQWRPQYAIGHLNLALALEAQKRISEAESEARTSIALDPHNAAAWQALAKALQDKDIDAAVAACRTTIDLEADNALAYSNLGFLLMKQRKLKEAEAACRTAVRLQPELAVAYDKLGMVLKERDRLEDAATAFRTALNLKPDFAAASFNLGVVLARQDKLDDAERAFRKAIDLQPKYPEAFNNLGSILYRRRKFKEAIDALRQAILLDSKLATAYHNLGLALFAQHNLAEAVDAFEDAIRLDPDSPEFRRALGNALRSQRKLPEAERALRRAIQLKPDYAAAHDDLGATLRDLGKPVEAEAEFRSAIAIKPDFAEAYFDLGVALADQHKLDDAIAAYRKAIDLKPDYGQAHSNLGSELHQAGKLDEALAAYRKATEYLPHDAVPFNNLGMLLLGQGRFEEALEPLKKALELRPPDSPLRAASQQRLDECRHWLALDGKLAGMLDGSTRPADAAEQLEYGRLCKIKKLFAAATRLHREAFAADAKLEAAQPNRYVAGCSAALAGCGLGKDADKLDDTARADLRRQALDWLRKDLAYWDKALTDDAKANAAVVRQAMAFWQANTETACVRDKEAQAKLPDDERKQWNELWSDVAALQKRAQ
jgi:Flp pilus assembly protein TadD